MRSLILGFDSFDSKIFESFVKHGRMPNLQRLADQGGYSPLRVSYPPQTEVSWTSIATGADPGTHGIFDFVHRNPETYSPYVSILRTHTGRFGTQFVPPYRARTLFEEAIDQGYPATSMWWPAMFPARPELPVRTIPGLGTPDIKGQLGVGALYTSGSEQLRDGSKTPVIVLSKSNGHYQASLQGPWVNQKGTGSVTQVPLEFELIPLDKETARLSFGRKHSLEIRIGQWSPILEISFPTSRFLSTHALTRAMLTSIDPVKIYFLPLQIHPMHSLWRYAAPQSFIKETWKSCGPFLSLGWPQDTTGLEDGCITDDQFLALCDDIFESRANILKYHLGKFREGVLACIFDDLDRVQHMFRRDRPDIVEHWYEKLDHFVGQMTETVNNMGGEKIDMFVMSDHGFDDFTYKVHINKWLLDNGYLNIKEGASEKSTASVDWSRTKAYAIGLNSLYINLTGREGQGIVPVEQIENITAELKAKLGDVHGPDDKPVFKNVLLRNEAFSGPLLPYGPDLVLGYDSGYRASAETGLGKWHELSIEENNDHWSGDHCIDAQNVPGVLFSSKGLKEFPNPSFRDIPPMIIGKYLDHSGVQPPLNPDGESQQTIEERLKGLGYL